ncbi:transposase [Yersinia mollaretii]|uniref:transposase n=2 Tax=Yersinia mollaretii TaxID=33060 RepID=UPI001E455689|nr:transposase [Yersinia mollaretii]
MSATEVILVVLFGDQFGCYNFSVHLGSDASTAKWAMSVAHLETRACARIACPLRGFPHSSFRLTDGFTRVPPRDA